MSGSSTTDERTANEIYLDAALRHQVDLRRYSSGEIKDIRAVLLQADRELVRLLRDRLSELGLPASRGDGSVQRLRALLKDVRIARKEALDIVRQRTEENLEDVGTIEAHHEVDMLEAAIPIRLELATVSVKRIHAIVKNSPFQGQILAKWFDQLDAGDQQRLERAITLGITNGETVDQIIRRVVGTRAASYQDGALSVTRRNAEAIVRTAVNHVSNAARQEVWDENSDILSGERWTATLDGRTSAYCRAMDGKVFRVGSGPRPPGHFNCRSVMVAVLNGIAIVGERPYVVDTRRPGNRRTDFRKDAEAQAGSAWKGMSSAERNAATAKLRNAWAQKNIGRVPAATTYQQWLSNQDAAFQDKVLGQKKGRLFRQGGLQLDQFVDRAGNELNLSQLKELYPSAWARAGM